MPMFDSYPARRRSLCWAAALIVIALTSFALGAGAGVPIPAADGEGPWMNPVNNSECELAGTVCAEWPVQSAGMAFQCCVDSDVVGTFQNLEECKKALGVRAL